MSANLNIECCNGEAWVTIHQKLQCPPHPQPPLYVPKPRRSSPSHLRRRARRALARAAAEKAASTVSTAVQTETVYQNVDASSVQEKPNDCTRAHAKHASNNQQQLFHNQAVLAVPPQPAEQQPLAYPPDV